MTWSIIGRDPDNGMLGLAIASRFFAVGAMCIQAESLVGAVSTQALMNPLLAPRSLALLREELTPDVTCRRLIAADQGARHRQLHLMSWGGQTAAHTGADCVPWCGHQFEQDVSVAGNMLAGPAVVGDTLEAFINNNNLPLVERLLAAMTAGEAAGGDKRGKQSAAVFIQGNEPYPRFSMRVDDHPDPLVELFRLYDVAKDRFIPFSSCFPTPERPYGILDREHLECIIERERGEPLRSLSDVSVERPA
jgi:uncharacterized Ntn-hydrolase superfamily protein